MDYFKRAVKSLFHAASFDLHRVNPGGNPSFQLFKALN